MCITISVITSWSIVLIEIYVVSMHYQSEQIGAHVDFFIFFFAQSTKKFMNDIFIKQSNLSLSAQNEFAFFMLIEVFCPSSLFIVF